MNQTKTAIQVGLTHIIKTETMVQTSSEPLNQRGMSGGFHPCAKLNWDSLGSL